MRKLLLITIFTLLQINSFATQRSYEKQVEFIKGLGSNFSYEIYGEVKYNSKSYPLYKITYNPSTNKKQRRYLIISGVHGNEPAPVYAIGEFLLELDRKPIADKNLTIDFFYILNPWGFETNNRLNGISMDINRDLKSQKSQEIAAFRKAVHKVKYEKVFDFHEATAGSFFLYCYGKKNKTAATAITQMLASNEVSLDSKYKDHMFTAKDGIIYIPYYARAYMRIKNRVTTGIYFNRRSSNVFTFETPKGGQMAERKRTVRLVLDFVMAMEKN
ncbi:MAG: DUF2817 domain-containing protein [Spirochaetales bacterium]|nr:DUF2817 domain-containing protein [Spirochaetales bacterium]